MDSFVLSAYASLAASRTLLHQLLACPNFTLEAENLSFWYIWKKWFLWTMAATQVAESHEDEWGFNWYFLWGIYTSIQTWTHSQNSLAASEAPSLKISSHRTSLKWSQNHPNQYKNSHKLWDETGHPIVNLMESQWKLRQQHDQNFPLEGKPL